MAYYDPDDENATDPNAAQQTQTGPESGVISGQGSTPSANSSTPAAPNAPDNPGNFVGIQQYLAQNKPQAAKLGETVGNYVTEQGTNASNALTEGQTHFDQDVGQSRVDLNQDLFNQAQQTPEQVAADQAKKAEFQKMRDAQYQGPSSLEETDYYQPINMQIQNALGAANNTQSTTGRSSLLADIQKQNNQKVSRGAANLDSALLSVSPDSRTILSSARDSVLPIQDQLNSASQSDAAKAADAAAQTAATHQAIQSAFSGPTGVQGQLESSLKSKADAAVAKAGSDSDAILNLLKTGNKEITDDQLKILGLTRNQYSGLVNDQSYYKNLGKETPLSDLTNFATRQSPSNLISAQNIATPEDYARYAALNDLMGTSNGFLNDPSQAGKAQTDNVDFNYDATPNALKDRITNLTFDPMSQSPTASKGSFNEINNRFNLDTGKGIGGISDLANSLASYPNDYGPYYSKMLSTLQNSLAGINQAYGTNLAVPSDYMERANQMVHSGQAQLRSNPGLVSGRVSNPSDADFQKAAQIVAYTTYLNNVSKNPQLVRS